MASKHFDEIRSLPLFAETSDTSFHALVRGAYVQNFPPHMELITEGEGADFLHIVSSGCVELFSSWADRETSVSFLREHSTFILAATINDRPYLVSGRTLEKSRIIMIPSEDIRAAFRKDSEFARSIVTELANCYRSSVRNLKDLKLRTSLERLANYLLKQHIANGSAEGFELDVEKKRLAAFLGMTPENLSRAFAGLKEHGVLMDGQSVKIVDPKALQTYARPDPLIDDWNSQPIS